MKGTQKQRNEIFLKKSKESMTADNGYNFRGNSGREPGIINTKGKR